MVAYSFRPQFEAQIVSGAKFGTVRGNRRNHAKPGDAIQLYVGMRTKKCRKIMPDVKCTMVCNIEICTSRMIDNGIASITIDGRVLTFDGIETFARLDGFAPEHCTLVNAKGKVPETARENMGLFWLAAHGEGRFDGKLIIWGQDS